MLLVFPPLSNESIREAVRLWRLDQAQATEKYNHINKWNTSQVTDMRTLFYHYKTFNENISEWDVSNVTNMSYMFSSSSSFNQDVSKWVVSNVTNMSDMFHDASSFNQDVSEWDVSNVTDMSHMFYFSSSFNQDVSKWDVSNVTDMSNMFSGASSFDQDVSKWDVSKVTDMSHMFHGASSFNQDVNEWDVSNVTNMSCMFYFALSYNQDVSKWDVSRNTFGIRDMFHRTEVEVTLKRFCGYESFFHGHYRPMSRIERQEFFSALFPWTRRKWFALFLVSQGFLCIYECEYLYNSDIRIGVGKRHQQVCDKLFDVEDLHRMICRFL